MCEINHLAALAGRLGALTRFRIERVLPRGMMYGIRQKILPSAQMQGWVAMAATQLGAGLSVRVVTGGDWFDNGKGDTCLPYSLKPCAHHVPATSKYPKCPSSEYPSPRCARECSESSYGKSYREDKVRAKSSYSVRGVQQIQQELKDNGPLYVAFSVYSDFPTYKSGVYEHRSGSYLGGHAVELMGWGTENGTPYWLIKNSWNEQWGNGGFFKIRRGTNECGIENDVSGGVVAGGPSPGPSPSPTPSPSPDCQDSWPFCTQDSCSGFLKSYCRKTCGDCASVAIV